MLIRSCLSVRPCLCQPELHLLSAPRVGARFKVTSRLPKLPSSLGVQTAEGMSSNETLRL